MSGGKEVVLLGATGLVGGHALELLLADPRVSRVRAIVRRPLPRNAAKLEQAVLNFDELSKAAHLLDGDAIICALGSTIKKAGSEEAFRKVDHDYPLLAARIAKEEGARHFLLVSSMGADSHSRVFYSRVKGEVEEALQALEYDRLTILRPSLLLGNRTEFRPAERLFQAVGWAIPGKYRPVHASQVSAVLVNRLHREVPGVEVIESAQIRAEGA